MDCNKRFIMTFLLFALSVPFGSNLFAAEEIRIVTTTKTFAGLAQAVAGEEAKVDYVAPPSQNVHFIQPRPSDILRLSKADVFIHAGLDLESWRYPLTEAAGKPALLDGGDREIDLSEGVVLDEIPETVSRLEGDIHLYGNPHYWLDPENGKIMARTIYRRLSEIYPEEEGRFRANLDRFIAELDKKIGEWKALSAEFKDAPIVAYHNSWPYFARFAGLRIVGFVEYKPGIPATPKHLAALEKKMKEENVKVIVKEPYFENRTPKKLAAGTGAAVLILAQSVGETKAASDYFSLFDSNLQALSEVLGK